VLHDEGFDLLWHSNEAPAKLKSPPYAAVLIVTQFDHTQIENALDTMRQYLEQSGGNASRLIACGFNLDQQTRNDMYKSKASKVVQPPRWEERLVAERILAALLGGFDEITNDLSEEKFADFGDGQKPYLVCRIPFKKGFQDCKLVGFTSVMREVFADIQHYAGLQDPILITGETGTGKELVAGAIYHLSSSMPKRGDEFVAINIAELTKDIITSELFGHAKGAFTGATQKRTGLLAEAGFGTVFIDEIGDLDPLNQAKLLRVLASRQIRPVGGTNKSVEALEARLIFATHKQLDDLCKKKKFRLDLYHRIKEGHTIHLRSLQERLGDLELLAKEFFREWLKETNEKRQDSLTFSQSEFDQIVDLGFRYSFNGNVRSLRGSLRSFFNNSLRDGQFRIERLRDEFSTVQKSYQKIANNEQDDHRSNSDLSSVSFDPNSENWDDFSAKAGKEYFTEVYRKAEGSIARACEIAGVCATTFYRYLSVEHRRRKKRKPASKAKQ